MTYRAPRPLRLHDLPPHRPQRPRPAGDQPRACGTTSATTCPFERQRAILRRAFDLGITHFDLANNYGPPYGAAETNFGRHLAEDFAPYRDELVISTKAGWDMWPGPTARAVAAASTCSPASTSR